jgi:hypothetical protein
VPNEKGNILVDGLGAVRLANIHRMFDPEPGELIKNIYPGLYGPLPRMDEPILVYNAQTGNVVKSRVTFINRKLRVYTVTVCDAATPIQPPLF